jgi:putative transposase
MTQSMSRVGHCIDNGPMEGFWGILKTEMYYLHKFDDYESLKKLIEDYIEYNNNRRYQKRLKCMTPIEYQRYLLGNTV